jgi:hypothetical protein
MGSTPRLGRPAPTDHELLEQIANNVDRIRSYVGVLLLLTVLGAVAVFISVAETSFSLTRRLGED